MTTSMITINIPGYISKKDDLVAVPRRVYHELIALKKKSASIYQPTTAEVRMLKKARQDFQAGHYVEWSKLRDELDNYHQRPRRKKA